MAAEQRNEDPIVLKLFVQIQLKVETIGWNIQMSLTFNKLEDL